MPIPSIRLEEGKREVVADGAYNHQPQYLVPSSFTTMTDLAPHINCLFAAELQFRLASAVRFAVTMDNQPLDSPLEWSHGKHKVSYEEIALRED
jgi:hypothetical protein